MKLPFRSTSSTPIILRKLHSQTVCRHFSKGRCSIVSTFWRQTDIKAALALNVGMDCKP